MTAKYLLLSFDEFAFHEGSYAFSHNLYVYKLFHARDKNPPVIKKLRGAVSFVPQKIPAAPLPEQKAML